jgi:hypothetical protein
MTPWIGHSQEVSDHFTNSRIKNIVKKKRIRSANIDLLVLPIDSKRLSLMVTELTHWTASVAEVPLGEVVIVTHFKSSMLD